MFLKKRFSTLLILTSLYSSMTFCASSSSLDFSWLKQGRGVFALQGGYANIDYGNSQHSYTATDGDVFVYQNSNESKNTGFGGVFIGYEWPLPCTNFATQAGLEYNYFGSVNINGLHTVGVEPVTSTPYNYRYHLQSQQVLAVAKLLYTTYKIYHPYVAIGLGSAFNHAYGFNTATSQRGSVNLTASFPANTQSAFSYNLSLGVDVDVAANFRVGVAYRYSDFGKFSLGNGQIIFNNYHSAVPFSLNNSRAYANQLLLSVDYLL